MRVFGWMLALVCGVTLVAGESVYGQEKTVDSGELNKVVSRAVEFLKVKGQKEDGSFSPQAGPGVTALVVAGILKNGVSPDEPFVQKSLKYLESMSQPDGGIYAPDSRYKNYETCLTMLAFEAANKDGRYKDALAKADKFIKGLQWNEEEGKEKSDYFYGGAGYGNSGRPDLSNTSYLIEALKSAGNDENSEAIQQALLFVSRTQNLESEHNTTEFPALNPDGGFYYTPAAGGNSQAGKTANGGLRSYASMTYAGLKSLLYAGVSKDDKRVKAAVDWLRKNYDLKSNPGMGTSGLYYYYHIFAKSLDVYGEETFKTEDGTEHYWRVELFKELASRQKEDGSWTNTESPRWLEDDPNLVTGYSLLALAYAKKK